MNKKDSFKLLLAIFVALSLMCEIEFTKATESRTDEALANEVEQSSNIDKSTTDVSNTEVSIDDKLDKVANDLGIDNTEHLYCSDDGETYIYFVYKPQEDLANILSKIRNSIDYEYIDTTDFDVTHMVVIFCNK